MTYIPTEPVESSNILQIGYDRRTQTLRLIFHSRQEGEAKRAYDYPMVPEREYEAMMKAESKGRFLNMRIKPMYAARSCRPEELIAPCCEHSGPNPTCNDECWPCNEWCCPGPPPKGVTEAIQTGRETGQRLMAAAGQQDEVPPDEVSEVPPAVPLTPDGEIDVEAIPDATHLFRDGEVRNRGRGDAEQAEAEGGLAVGEDVGVTRTKATHLAADEEPDDAPGETGD